jgi:hypothetical protein
LTEEESISTIEESKHGRTTSLSTLGMVEYTGMIKIILIGARRLPSSG